MTKKILVALFSVALSVTTLQASKAEQPATMVIIDNALNPSLPIFKDRLVHEVCILEHPSCSNGQSFMEGPGASSMNLDHMMLNGFTHGTQMAHAAILTNPNLKFIFIRMVGATSTGARQIYNEISFVNALKWVSSNKDKYNIRSVAISHSHYNLTSGVNYCPNTPDLRNQIDSVVSSGIAVFFPAGNSRDKARVNWPACLTPSAIVVSGSSDGDSPWVATNFDSKITDYFAYAGTLNLMSPNGNTSRVAGTSVSAQVASSIYMMLLQKNPTYNYNQMIDLLNSKSIKLVSRVLAGKLLTKDNI